MPVNDDIVNQVFQEFPGFKNSPAYQNGLQVIDATPNRKGNEFGSQRVSEFYQPGEQGGQDMLSNPGDPSKAVLEIYRKDELKDPGKKKALVVGEMLHGMTADPKWNELRQEFAQNFTPDAQRRNNYIYGQDKEEGEKPEDVMNRSTLDAYIRAGFMPKDKDSPEWTSMYSPQQSATLSKMMDYLRGRKK
jgi:hypothetical protein